MENCLSGSRPEQACSDEVVSSRLQLACAHHDWDALVATATTLPGRAAAAHVTQRTVDSRQSFENIACWHACILLPMCATAVAHKDKLGYKAKQQVVWTPPRVSDAAAVVSELALCSQNKPLSTPTIRNCARSWVLSVWNLRVLTDLQQPPCSATMSGAGDKFLQGRTLWALEQHFGCRQHTGMKKIHPALNSKQRGLAAPSASNFHAWLDSGCYQRHWQAIAATNGMGCAVYLMNRILIWFG